jgi:hypothetical protein
MHRFAFGLALIGSSISMIFPSSVMAFDLDTNAAATPDSTTRFEDPDEAPLPAPLPSAHLQDDGTSVQGAPATGLQIAPGTSLQITTGSGSQISPVMGLQMSPTVEDSNPADNRALIPRP